MIYRVITDGLPEFGSGFARRMIKESGPGSFDDLIKIDGLLHGTDVWCNVQRDMVIGGEISLKECISSRDDIFMFLTEKGMKKSDAYNVMESVRKGKDKIPFSAIAGCFLYTDSLEAGILYDTLPFRIYGGCSRDRISTVVFVDE